MCHERIRSGREYKISWKISACRQRRVRVESIAMVLRFSLNSSPTSDYYEINSYISRSREISLGNFEILKGLRLLCRVFEKMVANRSKSGSQAGRVKMAGNHGARSSK